MEYLLCGTAHISTFMPDILVGVGWGVLGGGGPASSTGVSLPRLVFQASPSLSSFSPSPASYDTSRTGDRMLGLCPHGT